jgi:proliferating cell nuclear antigen PCNA
MPFFLPCTRKIVRLAQNLQAMDNSHVALVAVKLHADGFAFYRCDRPIPLGVSLASLFKVLKCAKDDDKCTLKANDDADTLGLKYEAHRASTLGLSVQRPFQTNVLSQAVIASPSTR